MKKMKKMVSLMLALAMTLSLAACGDKPANGTEGAKTAEDEYQVVMLMDNADGSVDDGSFLEGTWTGITQYCEKTGAKATYFAPMEESKEAYLNNIEQAINAGAKVVACTGFLFEEAVYEAQELYPNVKFILIDGRPHNGDYSEYKTADNTYSVLFSEQEAGFLAGYAAVKEGYRNLAFFGGMAVTSVVRYGYGYIEGADYAAKELGLNKGDVNITYWYSGDFAPTPEKLTTVTGWYESGTDVIFSCGASICENAFAAAEQTGKKCIGVDCNQAPDSETVVTSAEKNLTKAVYDALIAFSEDEFPGGKDATLGTADDYVGLPTDTDSWRFENFTVDEYNEIYELLKTDKDGIASNLYTEADAESPTEIPTEIVTLDFKN